MTTISFHDSHRPPVTSGDYTITAEQIVSLGGSEPENPILPSKTARFRVGGPAFRLAPQDVGALFPPANSIGDHQDALPHVTLTRSTLPWEREAVAGSGEPWLVLLLAAEGDPGVGKLPDLRLAPAPGPLPDSQMTLVDLPAAYLKSIMPRRQDLALLCHVRATTNPEAENAIVVGSRLPAKDRNHAAFLVSVEDAYDQTGFVPPGVDSKGNVTLVVLHHWRFTCASPQHVFAEQVRSLDTNPGALQSPAMAAYGTEGAVILPYSLRGGGTAAGAYRGPLLPGPGGPPRGMPNLQGLRSADALVLYREGVALFDATYAAAWELGRLLALQSSSYARGLQQWRGEARRHLIATRQAASTAHLPPGAARDDPHETLPESITGFLDQLATFDLVPPNYLLPDPGMLPPGSLRFFQVDRYWRDCLIEGALALGRVQARDPEHETALRNYVNGLEAGPTSGFLLRSEIVSDWPGLLVDGIDATGTAHAPTHTLRLSDSILLVLFKVVLAHVDLHLKPETLHMGIDLEKSKPFKWLRDADGRFPPGGQPGQTRLPGFTADVPYRDNGLKTIDVSTLRDNIATAVAADPRTFGFGAVKNPGSAFLALQMIESIPRLRFSLK